MAVSWIECTKLFKSPVRVVAAFLLRSRETKSAQKRQWQDKCRKLRALLQRRNQQFEEQRREISQLKRQVQVLECRLAEAAKAPLVLPSDPPLSGHKFGPRMICLAVTLAMAVGFRPAARVLKIFLIGSRSKRTCRTSRQSARG